MSKDRSERVAPSAEPTHFRVPVDDETMPLLLEQAEAAGCPPRLLLSVIVREVLAHAKAEGLSFAVMTPASGSKSLN